MAGNPECRRKEPGVVPGAAPLPEPETIDVEGIFHEYVSGTVDLVVVLGPTASGKTRYAVSLARKFNALFEQLGFPGGRSHSGSRTAGEQKNAAAASSCPAAGREAGPVEILSADSRQVYRGMDIGTGKDLDEYGEIPYRLIDIVPAGTRFDLHQWQQAFETAYKEIRSRGGLPILCGGTGLYIQAAICGYALPQAPPDPELRARLEQEDIEELREKLAELRPLGQPGGKPDDPRTVPCSDLQNKRRLIRALEVAFYENEHPAGQTAFLPKNPCCIGTLVSREDRIARIDRRLEERLTGVSGTGEKTGRTLIDEVRELLDSGIPYEDLMYYGLEYKFVTQYVLGILSYEEMKKLLSNAIHQFAKRQMTWFRGMERDGVRIRWTRP